MKNMTKKLIILPILAIYLQAQSDLVDDKRLALISNYKKMFNKIGEKRVGVDPREIDSVKNPFVKVVHKKSISKGLQKQIVKPKSIFSLQAVLNHRAKISGKWYKLNDRVGGMKIIAINRTTVWLKNSEFKKRLSMRKKNANFSIK